MKGNLRQELRFELSKKAVDMHATGILAAHPQNDKQRRNTGKCYTSWRPMNDAPRVLSFVLFLDSLSMRTPWARFWATVLLFWLTCPVSAAPLPIELEVAALQEAPFGAIQEWNRVLVELNVARVRLRGARPGDEPALEVLDLAGAKRYRLLGLINRGNELVLPGGAFHQGESARLRQFLEQLPARVEEAGVERGRFGLTREQFEQVFDDLSLPFIESTKGIAPRELVARLTQDFKTPMSFDQTADRNLRDANPFAAELRGLTTGTTLAAVLRTAGLQLVPQQPRGEPVALRIGAIDPSQESWPVGWKPLAGPRQIAPAMLRFTTIEIENYTLAKALEALGPHMGVPLVFDQRVLTARGIDPAKVQVRLPRGKTYIRRAVDSILSAGRLTGELRIDEAGTPFYWITQFGPDSPRAIRVESDNVNPMPAEHPARRTIGP
jgi:hypothetical protein